MTRPAYMTATRSAVSAITPMSCVTSITAVPCSRVISFSSSMICAFFFQAEDGIRDADVIGVQTCALPISERGELGGRDVIVLFGRQRHAVQDEVPASCTRVPDVVLCCRTAERIAVGEQRRGCIALAMRSEERRVGKECRSRRVA